ncbi:hypothetical protein Glove_423g81 [Diversispora epigaea]|uniref:Uncharacterized protein n=1 Tax=Diversispora epigaea TaxID=1348612 RepID=A0A397GUS8_9GLOM|nr:hypothetical protein Glove_423g81 [Diversispora epigaea]
MDTTKVEPIEGYRNRFYVKVNIYVDKRCGYECYHNYKMEEHWYTNCTGNRHCEISFKEYMELKQKPEVKHDIFTRLAIHRYELRIENLIRRVKHVRETAKKIQAVNIISQKWFEYMYRPDGFRATELAMHYNLL